MVVVAISDRAEVVEVVTGLLTTGLLTTGLVSIVLVACGELVETVEVACTELVEVATEQAPATLDQSPFLIVTHQVAPVD